MRFASDTTLQDTKELAMLRTVLAGLAIREHRRLLAERPDVEERLPERKTAYFSVTSGPVVDDTGVARYGICITTAGKAFDKLFEEEIDHLVMEEALKRIAPLMSTKLEYRSAKGTYSLLIMGDTPQQLLLNLGILHRKLPQLEDHLAPDVIATANADMRANGPQR